MLTPAHGKRVGLALALPTWAADNECFARANRFDFGVWLAWLGHMAPARATCLFATVPDVVGDAAATRERWDRWSPAVRATGYPLAYVGQDGQSGSPVPWDELDTLFIGGTTPWKVSHATAQLVREAIRRGKPVHMGRVNSERRLLYASRIGCDSCDGTFMAINPQKALRVMGRAVARANAPQLPLGLEEGR